MSLPLRISVADRPLSHRDGGRKISLSNVECRMSMRCYCDFAADQLRRWVHETNIGPLGRARTKTCAR